MEVLSAIMSFFTFLRNLLRMCTEDVEFKNNDPGTVRPQPTVNYGSVTITPIPHSSPFIQPIETTITIRRRFNSVSNSNQRTLAPVLCEPTETIIRSISPALSKSLPNTPVLQEMD